jgi:hypothetical protein
MEVLFRGKCSPHGRPQRRLSKSSMTLFLAQAIIPEDLNIEIALSIEKTARGTDGNYFCCFFEGTYR